MMPLDSKQPDPPNPLDKLLAPGWREKAAEAEACWAKTFRTPSARTADAIRMEAAIRSRGQGGRPW